MNQTNSNEPVLLVVHSRHSRPGQVKAALDAKGWRTERCCPRAGDALPESMDGYKGAVVFGGPMSANDDHLPFIRAELDWIPKVLDSGRPFFGVCLGAQMLARCLGATVAPHPDGMFEIGYFRIEPTPQADGIFKGPLHVYHWHGEGFDLPAGAELLVTGEIFRNQAYRYGESAYGVQFHPEMQEEILKSWMKHASHRLSEPGAQQPKEQLAAHARHGAEMHHWLDDFVDAWLTGKE